MADESISVKIDGDARGFIKASAEVAKAAEKMADTAEAAMGDAAKAANNLEVEIKQIGDEAGKAAPKVESLNKSQANLATNTNSASVSFKSLQQASTAAFAALLANPLAQVATAIGLITRAIGEASESEREAAAIFAAFGTDTAGLEKTTRLVKELADSTGLFDEGNIAAGAAALKELGATQGQIEALLPAATNLAAVYGTTIPDAVKRLAGGIVGSTEGLRNFGINVKNNSTTAERYTAILERNARATEETKRLSEGLTGAMSRLGIATEEAFGSFGENFGPALSLAIDGITKLLQAIALVPPAVMLAAESIVNLSGNIGIAMGAIGEKLENFFSGKGFKSPRTDMFWAAWRKQGDETFGKTFKDFQARLSALLGGPTGRVIGATMPDTRTGLIKPPGEPPEAPAAATPKTLLQQAQEMAKVSSLFGIRPDKAMRDAIMQMMASSGLYRMPANVSSVTAGGVRAAIGTGAITTEQMELLGALADLDVGLFNNAADRLSKISDQFPDSLIGLQKQLSLMPARLKLAEDQIANAQTGQQLADAEQNRNRLLSDQKSMQDRYKNLQDSFVGKFGDLLANFLQQFASTIGASLAGGQGPSGGTIARGVAGFASGALGIASAASLGAAPLDLGIISIPLSAALAGLAAGVKVIGDVFGGFLDQQDANSEYLKTLVEQGKQAAVDARLLLGAITQEEASFIKVLEPLRNQAMKEGGQLGGAQGKLIGQFGTFGDPEARKQLGIIAQWITGAGTSQARRTEIFNLLNQNVGLGLEANQKNIDSVLNMMLQLFSSVEGFARNSEQMRQDEEKRKNDEVLRAIGSTPRNPVYVYDVTPKEEQFTFAPREAFFRAASMRQLGYNDVNLSAARA